MSLWECVDIIKLSLDKIISFGENLNDEKYNIDISKIPAGKYLVRIVNGKTYTTPQKLIIF